MANSKWSKVGAMLAPLAPIIGGALGGPAGASVGALLADKLGVDSKSPDAVAAAISANPTRAVELALEVEKTHQLEVNAAHAEAMGQIEINKIEAAHPSVFVSGGRPAAIWVCVYAFAWHFAVQPMLDYALTLFNITPPELEFDMATLLTVLGGLLGLGGMRSFEKHKGVARVR